MKKVAPLETMAADRVTKKTTSIVTILRHLYALLRKSSYFRSETELFSVAELRNKFQPGMLEVEEGLVSSCGPILTVPEWV